MKLSEIKGEAALDVLADIIEPASEIMSDPKVKDLFGSGNKGAIVKLLIKNHKKSIIEILAAMDGVPVEEYSVSVLTLPIRLVEILNDQELISFFTSPVLMGDQISSTAPTVNTTVNEK